MAWASGIRPPPGTFTTNGGREGNGANSATAVADSSSLTAARPGLQVQDELHCEFGGGPQEDIVDLLLGSEANEPSGQLGKGQGVEGEGL